MKMAYGLFGWCNIHTAYTYGYAPRVPSIDRLASHRLASLGARTTHRHAHDVHHQRIRLHAPDRRRQQTRGRGEEIRRRSRRQGTHRPLVFTRRVVRRARSLGRKSRQPPVATVRSPRRGESASPRGADARRARARATRKDGSIFFYDHPDREAPAFSRGGATRGRRRRILGRSRVSPRFYPPANEGSVGVDDPGASRRARARHGVLLSTNAGSRMELRRSGVPSVVRARRRFGRRVARLDASSIGFD